MYQQPISFSRKLIHLDSFYASNGTPSNFVFNNNSDPSLSKVRHVSLKSISFLNSVTNINNSNNTLYYSTREQIFDFALNSSIQNPILGYVAPQPLRELQLAGTSELRVEMPFRYTFLKNRGSYNIILYLDPNAIMWGPNRQFIEGSEIRAVEVVAQENTSFQFRPYLLFPQSTSRVKVYVLREPMRAGRAIESFNMVVTLRRPNDDNLYATSCILRVAPLELEEPVSLPSIRENGSNITPIPDPDSFTFDRFDTYYILITGTQTRFFEEDVPVASVSSPFTNLGNSIAVSELSFPLFNNYVFQTIETKIGNLRQDVGYVDLNPLYIIHYNVFNDQVSIRRKQYDTIDELMNSVQSAFLDQSGIRLLPTAEDGDWLNDDIRLSFTFPDNEVLLDERDGLGTYNPMAFVLGLRSSNNEYSNTFVASAIPDLSGIDQCFITSSKLCQQDTCLLGNNQSSSIFAIVPVTSAFGVYTFYQTNFSNQYSRSYQQPTDLSSIDIQLRTVTGHLISDLGSDVSIVLEIHYEN